MMVIKPIEVMFKIDCRSCKKVFESSHSKQIYCSTNCYHNYSKGLANNRRGLKLKKTCTKCGVSKRLIEFRKDSQKKDSLYSSCTDCVRLTRGETKRISVYRQVAKGIEQRKCAKCKKWVAVRNYYRRKISNQYPRGINGVCIPCCLDISKTPRARDSSKRLWLRQRVDVLSYYSNGTPKCACCGEDHLEFLAVDHIKGGGAKHRKEEGATKIVRWIRKNKYPAGFQVLCHNCNMAKGFYGKCPHKS